MPASSVSSYVSWAVYFATSLVLVAACSPVLVGVKNYSCGDSAASVAKGTAELLDALKPSITLAFSFHSPAPEDDIELNGRTLTAAWCGRSSVFQTIWRLPTATLLPGQSYSLKLAGDQVEVLGFV